MQDLKKLHKKFFGRGLLFLGWGVSCVGNGLKKLMVLVGYDLFVDISNIHTLGTPSL